MHHQCFELTLEHKIAHLTLNRPDCLNTMQPVFWRELQSILHQLHHHASARVLVISARGKHFCAGMAYDVFAPGGLAIDEHCAAGRTRCAQMLQEMQKMFCELERLRMPVIAAVQGGCVGSGLDLVCACDIRLAAADAFFCMQEINLGMASCLGGLQRLTRLVPEGVVHELAYTGRRLNAPRAMAVGLVNQVCDTHETLLQAAQQMAQEIAGKAPTAVWGNKQAIHYARDHSTTDALQQASWLQSGIWQMRDLAESFDAQQQARSPHFDDLPPIDAFADMRYPLK